MRFGDGRGKNIYDSRKIMSSLCMGVAYRRKERFNGKSVLVLSLSFYFRLNIFLTGAKLRPKPRTRKSQ